MSRHSHALITAVRSNKQTHFDSVLEDIQKWHHTHGGFVEQEFAQEIVDVFDYTIKSNHRDLLPSAVALLAHWIVKHASVEATNKLFDVVNNPWLVRELLTAVDDPRMLAKCNLEDVLYNQTGVIRRKINTDELMLFVKLPAPKCIEYLFSDPFVLKALNQEEQADKNKRLGENDHIFWSLTDPSVKSALSSVLGSLFLHTQTRWVGYYMTAVCKRGSLEAFHELTQHHKFTSLHLHEIETFFSRPIDFQVNAGDFISQIKPHALSLQALSSHIASLMGLPTFHFNRRKEEISLFIDRLEGGERIEIYGQALKKYYAQSDGRYDLTRRNELLLNAFSSLSEVTENKDLDGLLHSLPQDILDVVRAHPFMQQRILCSEVTDLSDSSTLTKRKM